MKFYYPILIVLLLVSCHKAKTKELFVLTHSKWITTNGELVLYKNKVFSGVLFELGPNQKDTIMKASYDEGLLNGLSQKWFDNKQLMETREYKNGKKNGKQIAYWDNGRKRFEYTAKDDAMEGEMREWMVNGKLYHLAHYENGQEEGTQKMFYENGKIRANYIMVKGRRYGLLGTKNCKNVSDSIFVVK